MSNYRTYPVYVLSVTDVTSLTIEAFLSLAVHFHRVYSFQFVRRCRLRNWAFSFAVYFHSSCVDQRSRKAVALVSSVVFGCNYLFEGLYRSVSDLCIKKSQRRCLSLANRIFCFVFASVFCGELVFRTAMFVPRYLHVMLDLALFYNLLSSDEHFRICDWLKSGQHWLNVS